MNLTDGLDGLAIGPVMISGATFLLLSYAAGNAVIADYLAIKYVPGAGQLAIFCGALVGGGLGFLWFNASPAELFMGDVGALALGGALGTIAVLIRQEILLAMREMLEPGVQVFTPYGATEALPVACISGEEILRQEAHTLAGSAWYNAEPVV